jgi:hypothetical protein
MWSSFIKNISSLQFWLALIFSTVITIVLTYPGILKMTDHFIGAGGDSYQYLGFETMIALRLKAGEWPFSHTTLWRYPIGIDFARSYDSVLSNVYGGLLAILLDNYTLAYNLTILSSLVFNGLCSYLLFQYLTKSKLLSLIGSVGYGFSFYNLARASGHANLLLTGGFALFLYSVLNLRSKANWKNFFLIGLSVAVIQISSAQYFVMFCIVGAIVSLLTILFFPQESLKFIQLIFKQPIKLLGSLILPFIFFIFIFSPVVMAVKEGNFVWRTHHDYSPHLVDFVIPNTFLPVTLSNFSPIPFENRNIEHVVYLGILELILFFIATFKTRKKRSTQLLITLVSIFFVFSLGTKNPDTGLRMPYSWLINTYPFAAISEPNRYIIIVNLFMLIVIANWLNLYKKTKKYQALLILTLLVMILERISWQGYFQTFTLDGPFVQVVKNQPGKAVLDLPANDSRYNQFPALYQKSIVFGYTHWLGDTFKTREFIDFNQEISRYFCDKENKDYQLYSEENYLQQNLEKNKLMLQRLKASQINTLVVHKDYALYWDGCRSVLSHISQLFPPIMNANKSGFKENQAHTEWAGSNINTGLFFPQKGSMRVIKINLGPSINIDDLEIKINDQKVDLEKWNFTQDDSIWMSPKDQTTFTSVTTGSKLTVKSPVFTDHGFITIWYYYDIDNQDETKATLQYNDLEKIFEDKDKAVYNIL